MKALSWISASLFLLLFTTIANAQPGCGSSAPGTEITKLRPVAGAPFSADIVLENSHQLSDGTHLVVKRHGQVSRDSAGRSRCELEDAHKTITVIEIVDPVAKVAIRLDTRKKFATVTHIPQTPQQAAPASTAVVEKKPEKPAMPNPRYTMEKLDSREIDGIPVTGTRSTNITEAGEAGNDKPIVTTMEHWYSSDLKLTLLSIRDDPRGGKFIDKLVNIQRIEPDPSVFHIPDGYTVKDRYCRAGDCSYDSE
ncbi:MAG: hypothetical protein LAO78_03115 [Acidobacteriia bacterium]|nr:hypothetical protein [Terriglobia bacterium]